MGIGIQDCCLVFPNKRAGLFFSKDLAGIIDKPVFSPLYRTINELMQDVSGWHTADPLYLLSVLYNVYKEHTGSTESFDEFYPWGEMLLSDFDDIDKYLVDAKDLFRNLSNLKEIDSVFDYITPEQKKAILMFWNHFSEGKEGKIKKDFAGLWQKLYDIYYSFRKELDITGRVYGGMIYRRCAEGNPDKLADNLTCKKYVFVGFNVLNASEKMFFRTLKQQGKAIFLWDYDEYYIKNTWHEAGYFMRSNIKEFPAPDDFKTDTNGLSRPPSINIFSTPSQTGQAVKVAGLLSAMGEEHASERNTAVILPDEHLLLPLLNNLPPEVSRLNITMGYPLSSTPVFSFYLKLSALQRSMRKEKNGVSFYYHDLLSLLAHTYILNTIPDTAGALVCHINKKNRIRINIGEIMEVISDDSGRRLFELIFEPCNDIKSWIEYLQGVTEYFLSFYSDGNNGENKEFLYTFYTALKRAGDTFFSLPVTMSMDTFDKMFRKHLISLRIPFQGEPLEGLQILGVLETRVLDFSNIIICSMNEGFFPKTTVAPSFIPYNLRKGFGLMTHEHQDAMYAYYFYRLLHRADNITLIYNNTAGEQSIGEQSRFISQLIYEPLFNPVSETEIIKLSATEIKPVKIIRTPELQKTIIKKFSAGSGRLLSPSSLNTWMKCSLRFWFEQMEGLREADTVNEDMDASIFGSVLHKIMQNLYSPYKGYVLTDNILKDIRSDKEKINNEIVRTFASVFLNKPEDSKFQIEGRNIIAKEVLYESVDKMLETDLKRTPFTIEALEYRLQEDINITINGITHTITVGGIADRIDRINGEIRIIDYKTGNVDYSFRNIDELFIGHKDKSALFQILFYAGIIARKNPNEPIISAGIYSLKEIFNDNFNEMPYYPDKNSTLKNYRNISEEFESGINGLFYDIFNPEKDFTQTDDNSKCAYCPFAGICHRK